jgi:hypothetical protein
LETNFISVGAPLPPTGGQVGIAMILFPNVWGGVYRGFLKNQIFRENKRFIEPETFKV